MLSIYLILMVLFALAMVPIPSLIKTHKRADKQQQIEHSQLLQSLSHITRRHWRLHAQKLCDPLYSPAELDSTKEQIDEIMVLLQARINYRHCQHLENIIAHWQALSHCEQLAMLRHHHQQILQLSQQVTE